MLKFLESSGILKAAVNRKLAVPPGVAVQAIGDGMDTSITYQAGTLHSHVNVKGGISSWEQFVNDADTAKKWRIMPLNEDGTIDERHEYRAAVEGETLTEAQTEINERIENAAKIIRNVGFEGVKESLLSGVKAVDKLQVGNVTAMFLHPETGSRPKVYFVNTDVVGKTGDDIAEENIPVVFDNLTEKTAEELAHFLASPDVQGTVLSDMFSGQLQKSLFGEEADGVAEYYAAIKEAIQERPDDEEFNQRHAELNKKYATFTRENIYKYLSGEKTVLGEKSNLEMTMAKYDVGSGVFELRSAGLINDSTHSRGESTARLPETPSVVERSILPGGSYHGVRLPFSELLSNPEAYRKLINFNQEGTNTGPGSWSPVMADINDSPAFAKSLAANGYTEEQTAAILEQKKKRDAVLKSGLSGIGNIENENGTLKVNAAAIARLAQTGYLSIMSYTSTLKGLMNGEDEVYDTASTLLNVFRNYFGEDLSQVEFDNSGFFVNRADGKALHGNIVLVSRFIPLFDEDGTFDWTGMEEYRNEISSAGVDTDDQHAVLRYLAVTEDLFPPNILFVADVKNIANDVRITDGAGGRRSMTEDEVTRFRASLTTRQNGPVEDAHAKVSGEIFRNIMSGRNHEEIYKWHEKGTVPTLRVTSAGRMFKEFREKTKAYVNGATEGLFKQLLEAGAEADEPVGPLGRCLELVKERDAFIESQKAKSSKGGKKVELSDDERKAVRKKTDELTKRASQAVLGALPLLLTEKYLSKIDVPMSTLLTMSSTLRNALSVMKAGGVRNSNANRKALEAVDTTVADLSKTVFLKRVGSQLTSSVPGIADEVYSQVEKMASDSFTRAKESGSKTGNMYEDILGIARLIGEFTGNETGFSYPTTEEIEAGAAREFSWERHEGNQTVKCKLFTPANGGTIDFILEEVRSSDEGGVEYSVQGLEAKMAGKTVAAHLGSTGAVASVLADRFLELEKEGKPVSTVLKEFVLMAAPKDTRTGEELLGKKDESGVWRGAKSSAGVYPRTVGTFRYNLGINGTRSSMAGNGAASQEAEVYAYDEDSTQTMRDRDVFKGADVVAHFRQPVGRKGK